MGLYEHDFIARAFSKYPMHAARCAVETGTCLGYSTRRLSRLYRRVDTVELDADLSRKTQEGMLQEGYSNVQFHVGDSAQVLRTLVGEIHDPCLFYLDAHWSGDATVDWKASEWKGYGVSTAHRGAQGRRPSAEEQVPLLTELQIIHDHFAYAAVIYIDDLALFGPDGRGLKDAAFVGNDWSHLHVDDLKKACGDRLVDWIVDKSGHQVAIVLSGETAQASQIQRVDDDLLGLVMIVKNEAARIAEVIGTYKSIIDRWSILDTGSIDGTQDIIRRELDGVPGDLHEEPFVDFATSRNRALELHDTKTTFAIMPNGDSLVGADALRTFLEARRNDGATAYKIRIAPGHYYHPLVMRTGRGWHYEGRTHECLMGAGDGGQIPDVMLVRDRSQRTDAEWKARWRRDVQLLKLDIAENPSNPRGYFYLGQTYDGLGKYEDALTYYQRRAAMHGYFDETFEAKLRIAKMHDKLGHPWDQIMAAYLDAHSFDPRRAEPLSYIADHYHGKDDHALAYLFASRAADIPKPPTDLFLDEDVYSHRAAEVAAIHAFYTPTVSRAEGRKFAERAVRGRPHDERLRANWAFYARSSTDLFGAKTTAIDFVAEAPYVASTPSICRTSSGWRCVVRTVNYRIVNGQYLYPDGDNAIRTRNYMLELEPEGDRFVTARAIEMVDVADRPRTDYMIHGYEDCRLFQHGGRLYATATVCDLTEDGRREIVLMHLRAGDYAIEKVVPLRGAWSSTPQKNWMPLLSSYFTTYSSRWDPINGPSIDPQSDDTPMKIIYAAVPGQPATIFSIDPNVGVIGDPPSQLGHGRLRGGSQAIPFERGFLCLVHDVAFPGGNRMYLHRFVQLDANYEVIAMTDPFYFEKLGIEFAAGLDHFADKLVASYSVADASARLATLDVERVLDQLKTDYVV